MKHHLGFFCRICLREETGSAKVERRLYYDVTLAAAVPITLAGVKWATLPGSCSVTLRAFDIFRLPGGHRQWGVTLSSVVSHLYDTQVGPLVMSTVGENQVENAPL